MVSDKKDSMLNELAQICRRVSKWQTAILKQLIV
jgi:hypothetical protein